MLEQEEGFSGTTRLHGKLGYMPRYFFDQDQFGETFPDRIGVELGTLDAAIAEAQKGLAELACDLSDGRARGSLKITIRQEGAAASLAEVSLQFDIRRVEAFDATSNGQSRPQA